ncbi:TetR family transcriptional regulator [Bacillus sp. 349Y]|nr:TetR family transcriptional regulator [Bacillus sp. 349Y]
MKPSMEEKKRLKRDRIFRAASKIFSEKGYFETTVADIAKEAGVSFGTVFTYFETKEMLYETMILEQLEEIKPHFLDIQGTFTGDPMEIITAMVDRHVTIFSEKSEFLRLVQQVLARLDRYPALFEELDSFVSDFIESVSPVLEEGQKMGVFYPDPHDLLAHSYMSTLNGMRLTYIDDPSNLRLWEALKIQAIRLFGPYHHPGGARKW